MEVGTKMFPLGYMDTAKLKHVFHLCINQHHTGNVDSYSKFGSVVMQKEYFHFYFLNTDISLNISLACTKFWMCIENILI